MQVRARGEDLELGLRSDVAGALDLPLAGVVVESIGPAAAPPGGVHALLSLSPGPGDARSAAQLIAELDAQAPAAPCARRAPRPPRPAPAAPRVHSAPAR